MGRPPQSTLEVRTVDAAVLQPPPPPPPEDEPEEEETEEPPPTELTEQAAPLDLSQLEMALDPGFGDGAGGMLTAGRIGGAGNDADREKEADAVFSLADLDQAPRVVSQPPPQYPAEMRAQKARGTVYVLFVVDRNGRVVRPLVQKSTHSAFDRPALEAVRQWRFEPGKRSGQTVQFRMRVPITFACG
jgi:protein TonB